MQMHWPETEEVWKHRHICQSHLTRSVLPDLFCFILPSFSNSPDSHSGLDQSCDSNSGENSSNQLTHSVLVLPNTHSFSQKKWYCNSPTETCQVMLWNNYRKEHSSDILRHYLDYPQYYPSKPSTVSLILVLFV